jgi:hypothetical protein
MKQNYKTKDITVTAITNYTNSDLWLQMWLGRLSKLHRVFQKQKIIVRYDTNLQMQFRNNFRLQYIPQSEVIAIRWCGEFSKLHDNQQIRETVSMKLLYSEGKTEKVIFLLG